MFYGKHEHTVDEKNRLTLPAKFRDALAAGVVLARGIDRNIDVYPRGSWDASVARIAELDSLTREAREMKRYVFAGAAVAELDKQGRVIVPPDLRARGLGKDVVVAGVHDHIEIWDRSLGGSPRRSKGALATNVQRTDAADHVPVLADEVRELLAVQPGETIVDATFGAGGHSRLLATDLQGSGKLVAIDRDPTVRSYFDRVKASTRRADALPPRRLRSRPSQLAGNGVRADAVLLDLGLSSMQVDRPERGFSYATDAPLDMRMDRRTS